MFPSDLKSEQFRDYPPLARKLVTANLAALSRLPLSFLPSLLREAIEYDFKFPAERKALEKEIANVNSLSPEQFNEWFGGSSAGTVADFGSSDTVLHRKYGHALLPADAYSVEYRCVVFETDIPPQHFWQPIGGKYRVLWERNFKETAKQE